MTEPAAEAAVAKPKQRLSTAQMLHLMRLEMDRAVRHRYPISCLAIGLDGFRGEEDLPGRRALMPAIFKELKAVTFQNDMRGLGIFTDRYEIAVFPHATPEAMASLAGALMQRARGLKDPTLDGKRSVTLSIGVSHNLHEGPISFEDLIGDAEMGMELARGGGGDRFVQAREVETEAARLREELERQIEDIEKHKESFFGDQDGLQESWGKHLIEKVFAVFRAEPDQSEGVCRLQKAVIDLITEEIRAWRESSTVRAMLEGQRQVEQLERRVKKLTESLGTTEAELKRVASMKAIDLGLSSIYRSVQGLSEEDPYTGQKKEMLKTIFEANLALKSTLAAKPKE